jgi:hypothetical protein
VENTFWIADQGAEDGASGLINTLWEDHSLPIGSRWPHLLATAWAAKSAAPADTGAWFARAAVHFFGDAGARLGRSLAAQNLAVRNVYAEGKGGNEAVALRAERQVLDEAQNLLARGRLAGWPRAMLTEFVYARRLSLLQREAARAAATRAWTPALRRAVERDMRDLRREGLALWKAQCTCPSQKPAFLERYSAIEQALGSPAEGDA